MGQEQSGQSPLRLFHFGGSSVSKPELPQTYEHSQYIPNSYCQVKMKTVLVQKWLRWFALIKLNQANVLFKGNCLLCSCMQNTTSNVKKKKKNSDRILSLQYGPGSTDEEKQKHQCS